MTFDQLISQQRPYVERLVHEIARRNYLTPSDLDDFRAVVDRALERNDYELLRAFDGRSTWETYLQTVVLREFYLFQIATWGDWRPSGLAARLGPAALLLEELVYRDGFPLADAINWMRTAHRVDLSHNHLLRLAAELGLASSDATARSVTMPQTPARELRQAVRDALARLSPDDRLILELRFRDHQPLTRIATLLRVEARSLQRRLDTIKSHVRDALLAQGFALATLEAMMGAADESTKDSDQQWWDFVMARPSRQGKR